MSPTFAERFRAANDWTVNNQYYGGFPNCLVSSDNKHGIVTLRREHEDHVEAHDVRRSDLGNPSLEDYKWAYRLRLTAAHDYARGREYAHGFPNFHQADYGGGIVLGTIFYLPGISEYQDVPTRELGMSGNPESHSMETWFGRIHNYARNAGFGAGMPTGHYANYGEWVLGTILFPTWIVVVHQVPASDLNFPPSGGGGPVYVTVPRVVGKRKYDAVEAIERAGLRWQTYTPGTTSHHVCVDQNPNDGTQVRQGHTVNLTFELGGSG